MNWKPTAAPNVLERRARMLARARTFFSSRSILEVQTPTIALHGVSDPHISSLVTKLTASGERTYFLQTSPEYAMKRLLASGVPDIYQICKVFRDREIGSTHQPEFTMVEWYRRGIAMDEMIEETCAFITEISESPPVGIDKHCYRAIFTSTCNIDPLEANVHRLADCAARMIDTVSPDLRERIGEDRHAWLDLLLSHVVVPGLPTDRLSVIHHFPADQAALARLDPDEPELAERFEVFLNGLELANGYRELTDAAELRRRFGADNAARKGAGLPPIEPDAALLAALEHGLPECSGVAVGFDRVVMTACDLTHIKDAVSFAI